MANVIDELVVVLGLDPRQFTQGQREALEAFRKSKETAESFGKSIERSGRSMNDVLGVLKGGAVGILGALGVGEVASFVDRVGNMAASISRMSRVLNISGTDLSKWDTLLQSAGGHAGQIGTTFRSMQTAIQREETFREPMGAEARSTYKLIGGYSGKSMDRIILELAGVIEKSMKTGAMSERTAKGYINAIPGMTDELMLEILKGRSSLEGKLKGIPGMSPEDFKNAEAYVEELKKFNASQERLWIKVLPVLTHMTNALLKLFGESDEERSKRRERQERVDREAAEARQRLTGQPGIVGQTLWWWDFMKPRGPNPLKPLFGPGTTGGPREKTIFDNDYNDTMPGGRPSQSGAPAAARMRFGPQSNNNINNTTRIDRMIVNTAATDAKGIARDMRDAVALYPLASQANSALA